MPRSDAPSSDLYASVCRRMVETGEWDRITSLLSKRLNEAGWTDTIHHQTKETSRQSESPLTVSQLIGQIQLQADQSVSPAVKQEVILAIRQYLDTQIEK